MWVSAHTAWAGREAGGRRKGLGAALAWTALTPHPVWATKVSGRGLGAPAERWGVWAGPQLFSSGAGRDRACWGLRIWGQGEVGAGLGWRGPATLRAFPMCSVYVWAVPGASQIQCGSSEH